MSDRKRRLDIEGAYNVRDLGGYATQDGRQTRWGTFLRADDLNELTPSDQRALIDYGVRSVIDLRRDIELAAAPDVFAHSSEVAYHHQDMVGDPVPSEDAEASKPAEPADRILRSYSVWLDRRQPQIRETLATLADPAARPALYHCAGGKDRTGVISALLLSLAGVKSETIAEDYALSGRYLWDRYLASPDPSELLDSVKSWQDYQRVFCPPEGMLKVLKYLDDGYDSVDGFVRTIGVTDAQVSNIRDALLE